MGSRPSLLVRWLEPFVSGLWIFFLLAALWIACVWSFGLGDAALARSVGNRDLRAVLAWLIGVGDFAWVALAATNLHLWLAEAEGLPTARRWALILGGSAAALGAVSVWTGWPLGSIRFSTQLGMKLGPVPLGLPLLWYVIILGARQTVLWRWPATEQKALAFATGALVLLTDVSLEPVAAKMRGFWFWPSPGQPPLFVPPWTGSVAWFFLAALLTFALREERVASRPPRDAFRPAAIFLLLHAVLVAAHLGRFVRG